MVCISATEKCPENSGLFSFDIYNFLTLRYVNCVTIIKIEDLDVYVFTEPLNHWQDVTQGHFLSSMSLFEFRASFLLLDQLPN